MNNGLIRLGRGLLIGIEFISALLLVAVVVMNLSQIFTRYVLVNPMTWTEETMRYATVWMTMLAGSAALLRNEHMAIELLSENAPSWVKKLRRRLALGCIAAFCLLLLWEGLPAALNNYRQVSPSMRVPMTFPYLAIPVGAALMLVKTFILMVLPEEQLAQFDSTEPLA